MTQGIIDLIKGDITKVEADAIVNPSNSSLLLGAGVSGAINLAGGPSIQSEMNKLGHCPVGGAVITSAGNLPARFVIHAVGPRMGEGAEDAKLLGATLQSLARAEEENLASIVFPAISTGIFGFPLDRCARIMLTASIEHLSSDKPGSLERIIFCLWGDEAYTTFRETLEILNLSP